MTKLLQHQDSNASYWKSFPGCTRGLLQFFDFQQRLHVRRMLPNRRHADEKHSGGTKLSGSYVSLTGKEHGDLDDETNFPMINKGDYLKENSYKSLMRALISKKIHRKKKKKLPAAPQLLRTFSIHHWECDDYVLPNQTVSDRGASTIDATSCKTCSSTSCRHSPLLTKDIVVDYSKEKSAEGLLKQKEMDSEVKTDSVLKSKDFLDVVEYRISMDGVLDRVPYGQKVSDNEIKLKLFRSTSARSYSETSRDRFEIPANRNPHQRISRSRSLAESVDKYSRLLASVSHKEGDKLADRSISNKEGFSQDPRTRNASQRFVSTPEYRSHHFSMDMDAENEVLHEELSLNIPTTSVLDERLAIDEDATRTVENEKNNTWEVFDLIEETVIDVPSSDQATKVLEQRVLNCDYEKNDICKVSDSVNEGPSSAPCNEQEIEIKVDSNFEPMKPSPTSVLELSLSVDPVSPVKNKILEDSDVNYRSLDFNELASSANSKLSDFDASSRVETTEPTCDSTRQKNPVYFEALQIGLDQMSRTEFHYLRRILEKYCFSSEESFESWYTLNQQDADISAFISNNISIDEGLLVDLINEASYQVHEKHSSQNLCFSRVAFRPRRKPVGYHLLNELWAQISLHLEPQAKSNYMPESVVAWDFAKSDGWLDLRLDAEGMGVELEGAILDDLINELILEVDEFLLSRLIYSQ